MKESTLGIILGGLNILLMAVGCFYFLRLDRTAPEIILGEVDYVYEEDLPERILMEGVTAVDMQDGDLTAGVVIEKVVTDEAKRTAAITYGVADRAGNVCRASRILDMPVEEKPQLPVAGEAGNRGTGSVQEMEGQNPGTMEAEGTQESGREENTQQTAGSDSGGEKPALVFTARELRIKTGDTPEWSRVIGDIQDDKDPGEILLESLEVKGGYDTTKAGEYYLTLTVTDTDGNTSNAYPMKLVVVE